MTANAAAAGGRIIELDGIRGCACLLVVVGHYFGEVAHGARFLCLEWIGVDLFFCLSGFLIGGILLDNRVSPSYFATFYTRRGFRIFPIYYVTIILVLLALPRFPGLTESNYPASMYFGYTQNFVMSFTGIEVPQWLMPTWTLCVEEQFYLLLPVLLYATPARVLPRVLLLLIASASLLRLALVLANANILALHMLLPANWDLLFLGVLGAYAQRVPALRNRLHGSEHIVLKSGVLAGVAGLLLLAFADNVLGWRSVDVFGSLTVGGALTGFLLLIVGGSSEGRRFRSQTLRFLGQISYGLYLIHQPVAGIMHSAVLGSRPDIGTWSQAGVTVAAVAVSIGLASLSWTFLESPLIRLGHR